MEKYPVKYYFKDPVTQTEMNFSRLEHWGWAVGFPNLDVMESLDYKGEIPWPTLSEQDRIGVDKNYEELRKGLEEEE